MKPKTPYHKEIEEAIGRIYVEGLAERFADVNIFCAITEKAIEQTKQQEREKFIIWIGGLIGNIIGEREKDAYTYLQIIEKLEEFVRQIKEEK
jgi:hypothetical protein